MPSTCPTVLFFLLISIHIMRHIITRRLEFDAAHRVLGHETKCKHLHGHRYRAEVTFEAGLDNLGRVIDFGVVKELVGQWIDNHWDHNILLHPSDPLAIWYMNEDKGEGGDQDILIDEVFEKPPYLMPTGRNPTAENIAEALFFQSVLLLKDKPHVTVLKVRIYETPNCWADYTN